MEQQNNNLVLTKPNAFITNLQNNTNVTLAKFSRFTPVIIEDAAIAHLKNAEALDSLHRSRLFFENHYSKEDKELMIAKIDEQIANQSALLATTPKLETMGELYRNDEALTEKGLMILINDLRLFFQVDKMISTEGIISLCPLIIFEYASLSLEEIAVCFAQAKKGYYKELYNRLDGAIILSWIKQYNAEKLARVLERNYVTEVHCKIGIGEGRKDFKGDHDAMIQTAKNVIDIENAKRAVKSQNVEKVKQ